MNCNSLIFKHAILNIYPRLRSVIGYNLYTVAKDKKTFERIPEKVNTPKRIRSYLGSHFTGCLIIVPVSDIVLVSFNTFNIEAVSTSKIVSHYTVLLRVTVSSQYEAREYFLYPRVD